jgi:3-methyl-2-oxobutanoate hydroxymethyltransferase
MSTLVRSLRNGLHRTNGGSFRGLYFNNHHVCCRSFASKVSALSLNAKKRKGKKITMVTAYDYPSAVHVARAEIDMILVGDSVAMVELGYDTTQQMTVETMVHHCKSVKRGLETVGGRSMLIGDMPFGSYEYEDTDIALRNAYEFVKEGGCDAVKMEVRSTYGGLVKRWI